MSKKYDKQQVEDAIKLLKNKEFSGVETEKLISLLENYGYISQDLKNLIEDINQKKKDPDVQDFIIFAKINERIFKFLYPDDNNNFNMEDFPLVFRVCNQIMKDKREDLNKDILYLIQQI